MSFWSGDDLYLIFYSIQNKLCDSIVELWSIYKKAHMLLGYKITLAFMRILSLLCVCFLSSFVSNVSAQVVEKVFDITTVQ